MSASVDRVLPLGDPRLRVRCATVTDLADPDVHAAAGRLQAALAAFRAAHGFGRGIAAPQLGIPLRLVALDLGQGPLLLANPEITWRSEGSFTLWDDCMCFPDLLVKVRRQRSISVDFLDGAGARRSWERLGMAESELLQHELDHLDGVLAVDRALGPEGVIYRAAFDADPDFFRRQVDYTIQATIDAVAGPAATPCG